MLSILKKSSFLKAVFFAALLLTLPIGCKPSQEQMEKAVGEYLKKNPKVVADALKSSRPQRAPELPLEERIKKAINVPLNNAPVKGAENAPITIVEFSEFQCPFCKRVNPTIDQVLKDYPGKVRVAFRHNPLSFHQNAMSAAKASLAANEQGKFWEMHDGLFGNQQGLDEAGITKIAKEIGLDMKKFEADWKSTKYDAQIQEDIKFAQTNQATGTPSFFVNGVFLRGAQPVAAFKQVIDKLLESKEGKPASSKTEEKTPVS